MRSSGGAAQSILCLPVDARLSQNGQGQTLKNYLQEQIRLNTDLKQSTRWVRCDVRVAQLDFPPAARLSPETTWTGFAKSLHDSFDF